MHIKLSPFLYLINWTNPYMQIKIKALGMKVGEDHWYPCLVSYKEGHKHFELKDYP